MFVLNDVLQRWLFWVLLSLNNAQGTFRRCCEITADVLRENKDLLLTVVEVFLHDPLFKWALSPLRALERQQGGDEERTAEERSMDAEDERFQGNNDATKALLRVREKLQVSF